MIILIKCFSLSLSLFWGVLGNLLVNYPMLPRAAFTATRLSTSTFLFHLLILVLRLYRLLVIV